MKEAPLGVLDLLLKMGFRAGHDEWSTAIQWKRLDLMEWLDRNGCNPPRMLITQCAWTTDVAFLERCYAEVTDADILTEALSCALRHYQWGTVNWLALRGAKLAANLSNEVGQLGSAEIMQHLQEMGYSLNAKEVCDGALSDGKHEVLNFIVEHLGLGCERLDGESWHRALHSGSIDCVEWMASHSNCVPPCIDPDELECVAKSQFLHHLIDKGYAFQTSPMRLAVSTGDLNLVRRFYSQGYAIDEGSYKCALFDDHAHILKWFHEDVGKVWPSLLATQRPSTPKIRSYLLRKPVKTANK